MPVTAEFETLEVRIPISSRTALSAEVVVPAGATGVVLFAHGSGSSRFSPRNGYIASKLNSIRMATVLADLLTEDEEKLDEHTRELRFDIPLLTRRVVKMIDWIETNDLVATLPVGLFGASTGAAAALDAAAERPAIVDAVVSRGGRPDLASQLRFVHAPALLIVGSNDDDVLRMNTHALQQMKGVKKLEVVPGATHLFEEPGALEAVAAAAGAWFQRYLIAGH